MSRWTHPSSLFTHHSRKEAHGFPPPPRDGFSFSRGSSVGATFAQEKRSTRNAAWDGRAGFSGVAQGKGGPAAGLLQDRDAEALDELFHLAAQEGERGDDKEQILHARRVVVGGDDLVGHER